MMRSGSASIGKSFLSPFLAFILLPFSSTKWKTCYGTKNNTWSSIHGTILSFLKVTLFLHLTSVYKKTTYLLNKKPSTTYVYVWLIMLWLKIFISDIIFSITTCCYVFYNLCIYIFLISWLCFFLPSHFSFFTDDLRWWWCVAMNKSLKEPPAIYLILFLFVFFLTTYMFSLFWFATLCRHFIVISVKGKQNNFVACI